MLNIDETEIIPHLSICVDGVCFDFKDVRVCLWYGDPAKSIGCVAEEVEYETRNENREYKKCKVVRGEASKQ